MVGNDVPIIRLLYNEAEFEVGCLRIFPSYIPPCGNLWALLILSLQTSVTCKTQSTKFTGYGDQRKLSLYSVVRTLALVVSKHCGWKRQIILEK